MSRVYEGGELDLFSAARNWKTYWAGRIRPHLGARVLDVGAGLGENVRYLCSAGQTDWCALEPDEALAAQIAPRLADFPGARPLRVVTGMLADLPAAERFDTILYIDVLEHIDDDRGEMERAVTHLAPGGKIIVLCPAYPWLYNDFDRAIGHFRRHTRASMRRVTPTDTRLIELFHLDAIGLGASVANKLLLHQSLPNARQVAFWDGWLVPLSRLADPLIGYSAGKSIIGIWQREA